MTAWHKGPLLAFDTETTGPDPEEARVVTATCAWITPGQPPAIESWLINPGVEIPEGATAVHGITTDQARAEGQQPADALFTIAARIGTAIAQGIPVVAFNACFDLTLLDRELARHGITLNIGEALVVDPFVIDKHVDQFRRGSAPSPPSASTTKSASTEHTTPPPTHSPRRGSRGGSPRPTRTASRCRSRTSTPPR